MIIDRACKLEKVCDTSGARCNIAQPHFDADKNRVVATDGRIMAVVHVTETEGDTSGAIPLDALKASRKAPIPGQLYANGTVDTAGASYERPDIGQFPDSVLPKDGPKELRIALNPQLLLNLAQALGVRRNESVTLSFQANRAGGVDGLGPIKVTAQGDDFGVIMPTRM